jgi:hypothetical protein
MANSSLRLFDRTIGTIGDSALTLVDMLMLLRSVS